MAADQWLADYEAAKQTANDTLQLIQVRFAPPPLPLLRLTLCRLTLLAPPLLSAGAQLEVPRGRPRGQSADSHSTAQAGHAGRPAGQPANGD